MRIVAGTTSDMKIKAIHDAFHNTLKSFGLAHVVVKIDKKFDIDSGVPGSPINDQTFTGAQ